MRRLRGKMNDLMFQPYSSGGLSTGIFGRYYKVSNIDVVLACTLSDAPPTPSRNWIGYLEKEGEVMELLLNRMEEERVLKQTCEWVKMPNGVMRFNLEEEDIQATLIEIQAYLDNFTQD